MKYFFHTILSLVLCFLPVRAEATLAFEPLKPTKHFPEIKIGVFTLQGRREYQEDRAHSTSLELDGHVVNYFGVFDGHGGAHASNFIASNMHQYIFRQFERSIEQDIPRLLHNAFTQIDQTFLSTDMPSGSAALVGLLIADRLWVANTGDCRAILSRSGKAVELSFDHKPNREDELARIRRAGSDAVNVFGIWRVEGILAMSRAIGDKYLKHVVIPDPEVESVQLSTDPDSDNADEFIVLASDGLWDVFSNQDVVDIIHMNPQLRHDPQRAAEVLVRMAYQMGSMDNITVQVILLRGGAEAETPVPREQNSEVPPTRREKEL
eukprot:c4331_g1_i1.p1 GENE.c4331_g1_i1~~c4331_g1_i1.p1  ORF type:complete len:322 (+),score=70.80 c4331_g1_i1:131-1096(+)